MEAIEIRHVAHAYLEEVVEITGDQMAVEDHRHGADRCLERGEALRCRAIQHDPDDDQCPSADLVRHDLRADRTDVARHEQALRAAMAGRGAGVHPLRDLGVAHPPV